MGKIFFHWTANRVALLKIPSGSHVTKQWQSARGCLAEKSVCVSPRVSSEFLASSWLKFALVGRVKARFGTSQNEGNLDSSSLLLGSINGPCEKGESCCRVYERFTVFRMDLIFDWCFLIFYEQTSIFYRDFKLGFFFKLGEQGFISQKNEWDFCSSCLQRSWLRKRQIFFTRCWDCEV